MRPLGRLGMKCSAGWVFLTLVGCGERSLHLAAPGSGELAFVAVLDSSLQVIRGAIWQDDVELLAR
ncbi:MAG: hypothetical protein HY791_11720 [Deltaproteobacteria bacterium]|nr:hypothetical protein [Deltaproteobacteria bacterium]